MSYTTSQIAVDAVILTFRNNQLQVLLNKREKNPFMNDLELFGGLLQDTDTASMTIKRKLKGIFDKEFFVEQFHTFTNPDRDPRGRVISIGFVVLVPSLVTSHSGSWYTVGSLGSIAFDHTQIIDGALTHIKKSMSPHLMKHLLPELFPLNQLQKLYESIEHITYDNRNFRKKMKNSGFLEETDQLEKNVSHRPAKLYRFI